jgi:hypothetical protein
LSTVATTGKAAEERCVESMGGGDGELEAEERRTGLGFTVTCRGAAWDRRRVLGSYGLKAARRWSAAAWIEDAGSVAGQLARSGELVCGA